MKIALNEHFYLLIVSNKIRLTNKAKQDHGEFKIFSQKVDSSYLAVISLVFELLHDKLFWRNDHEYHEKYDLIKDSQLNQMLIWIPLWNRQNSKYV